MKNALLLLGTLALALSLGCAKRTETETETDKPKTAEPKTAEPKTAEPEKTAVDPAVIARGEHIAKLGGCQLCHTPMGPGGFDTSKSWAGGLEIPEVFGTWRSPNITQHKETGIGSWTDEQIKTAVRQGKRPDGSILYPVMPYPFYNNMSDEDADALVAYLRTIEPIEHAVARTEELKLPKMEVPPPANAKAPPASEKVAYGAYLASIMHCGMCHLPIDEKTHAPDFSRMFAGGMPFEVPMFGEGILYAPNLTPHETGIKNHTDEELMAAIRMMKKKDGGIIQGPMQLYQGAWFDLPDSDVQAIVAFLRSLPPVDNKVAASTFKPNPPPPAAAAN